MIDVPVRVRDALKSGSYKNNYRIVVLDSNGDEDFTIDNNNLISESVKLDERMCSDDNLKFGLCEGTNVEFQYFDFPNITNRKIKIYIDVNYRDTDKTLQIYSIPMGWFDIKECSRQADTGIIKASGYNKLLSDYLDQDVTEQAKSIVSDGEYGTAGSSIQNILDKLLDGYSINEKPDEVREWSLSSMTSGYSEGILAIFPNTSFSSGSQKYIHAQGVYDNLQYTLNPNDYYRFIMNEGLKDYVDALYSSILSTYSNWYTLYQDANGNFLTVSQLLNGAIIGDISGQEAMVNQFGGVSIRNASDLPMECYSITQIANQTITDYFLGNMRKYVFIPAYAWVDNNGNIESQYTQAQVKTKINNLLNGANLFCVALRNLTDMEKTRVTSNTVSGITSGLTLRALQSATFELAAQYGKLDRVTDLFSGVNLNGSRLYPSDTLYPASDLYPMSQSERADKAMYSNLWGDEGNVRSFRNLIITYKDSETNKNVTITKVVNADGTDDYAMDDNWLFKNLAWSSSQVDTYANAMVTAMQNVRWFPFQMWCAGLPYIETGDEIEVSVGGSTYPTYVLTRTLSGIQDLQDTYANGTLNIF